MVATLDGIPFDIDPHTVTWEYKVHTADKPYLGGKVIQVFGSSIGDITISGKYGRGDLLAKQLAFLSRMKALGNQRLTDLRARPSRFSWPEQQWDMQVLLMNVTNLTHDPSEFAPDWEITLFPVTGTDSLKTAAITTFIDRLAAGMGWRPGAFNGGSPQQIRDALNATGTTSLNSYLAKSFGLGTTPSSGTPPVAASPSTTAPTSRVLTANEIISVASNAGFVGNDLRIAGAIAKAESGLNPAATNLVAPDYSIGLWQINMLAHGETYGSEAELKVPERNALAAYQIYVRRNRSFAAWSTYTNGAYQAYMAEMTAAAASLRL